MGLRTLQTLAIVATALALVPAGAHFFELFSKMQLGREEYFVVQGIYRGWALFGIVLFAALVLDLALTVANRHRSWPFRFALAGFLLMAATLAVFFTWTFPANQATSDWTIAPDDWEALRRQWEYAHAASAVLTFGALVAITLSVVTAASGRGEGDAGHRTAGSA